MYQWVLMSLRCDDVWCTWGLRGVRSEVGDCRTLTHTRIRKRGWDHLKLTKQNIFPKTQNLLKEKPEQVTGGVKISSSSSAWESLSASSPKIRCWNLVFPKVVASLCFSAPMVLPLDATIAATSSSSRTVSSSPDAAEMIQIMTSLRNKGRHVECEQTTMDGEYLRSICCAELKSQIIHKGWTCW